VSLFDTFYNIEEDNVHSRLKSRGLRRHSSFDAQGTTPA